MAKKNTEGITATEAVAVDQVAEKEVLVVFLTDGLVNAEVLESWQKNAPWAEILVLDKTEINAVAGAEVLTALAHLSVADKLTKNIVFAPLHTLLANTCTPHDFEVIKLNSLNHSLFGVVPNILQIATVATTLEILSIEKSNATDKDFEEYYLKTCDVTPKVLFGNLDCHFSVFLKNDYDSYAKDILRKIHLERKIIVLKH